MSEHYIHTLQIRALTFDLHMPVEHPVSSQSVRAERCGSCNHVTSSSSAVSTLAVLAPLCHMLTLALDQCSCTSCSGNKRNQ